MTTIKETLKILLSPFVIPLGLIAALYMVFSMPVIAPFIIQNDPSLKETLIPGLVVWCMLILGPISKYGYDILTEIFG